MQVPVKAHGYALSGCESGGRHDADPMARLIGTPPSSTGNSGGWPHHKKAHVVLWKSAWLSMRPATNRFDRRRPFAQAERQRSGKALSWRLETHKLKIKASAETSVVDSRTPTGRVAVNNSPSAADTADRMALGHGSPRSETTRLGLTQAGKEFVGSFWRAVRENGEADDWPFPQGRSDPGFSLGRLFGSDQKRDIGPRCKLRYSDL
jgi:hypothetical protein